MHAKLVRLILSNMDDSSKISRLSSFLQHLVERREEFPPLSREDLWILLPLVSGVLLASPELHKEYSSREIYHCYHISLFLDRANKKVSLLPRSKPVMITIPRTPRVSYQ